MFFQIVFEGIKTVTALEYFAGVASFAKKTF